MYLRISAIVSLSWSVNEWTFSFERKWGILLFGGLVTIQPLIDKISVAIATAIAIAIATAFASAIAIAIATAIAIAIAIATVIAIAIAIRRFFK